MRKVDPELQYVHKIVITFNRRADVGTERIIGAFVLIGKMLINPSIFGFKRKYSKGKVVVLVSNIHIYKSDVPVYQLQNALDELTKGKCMIQDIEVDSVYNNRW